MPAVERLAVEDRLKTLRGLLSDRLGSNDDGKASKKTAN